MDETLKEFGERLRLARTNKKITQRELAEKIGAAKGSIPAYENGQTDPGMTVVKQIADALDVHIEWLISGQIVIDVDAYKESVAKIIEYVSFLDSQNSDRILIDLGTDKVRAAKIKEYIRFLDSQQTGGKHEYLL